MKTVTVTLPNPVPCPFCGHAVLAADVVHVNENGGITDGFAVCCMECEARGPVVIGLRVAVILWNRSAGGEK